jgi:hypothetical protein
MLPTLLLPLLTPAAATAAATAAAAVPAGSLLAGYWNLTSKEEEPQ